MSRRTERLHLAFAMIAALAVLGAFFLFAVGIDALEGRSDFQFFADSQTYHEAARGGLDHIETLLDMVSVAANFLGPLVLLRIAGENYYVVLALNCVILGVAVHSMARSIKLDPLRFLILLLLNPLTASSLLSVNKEIISIAFLALLLRAFAAGSAGALIAAAVTSLLVRWQLTLFLVVVVLLVGGLNPLRKRRWTILLLLLIALSILYVQLADVLAPIRANFEQAAEEYEGSGFYEQLVSLQNDGWYWLIFPVKAAHLLFGMGLRLDRLVSPTSVYNDFWQLLHSTTLLLLFVAVVRSGRFQIRNDLVWFSLLYVAIFAITPIYTPRYFYPVYVLWAASLCAPPTVAAALTGARARRGPARAVRRPARSPLEGPAVAPRA